MTNLSNLSNKNIPELYELDKENTDEKYNNRREKLIENFRFKMSLLSLVIDVFNAIKNIPEDKDLDIHLKIRELEKKFLQDLGIDLNLEIDSNLEKLIGGETIENNGMIVYTNHHGGGLETYVSRAILSEIKMAPLRWVLKDSLTRIPFYGKVILKTKPIVIEREKTSNKEKLKDIADSIMLSTRNNLAKVPFLDKIIKPLEKKPKPMKAPSREKLMQYGRQIAEALKNKETVVIAFEGTRSKDGEIIENGEYSSVAPLLDMFTKMAIKKGGEEFANLNYNKVLMTVDTLNVLPQAWEKKPFAETGIKSGMGARLQLLPDDISLKPDKKGTEEPTNNIANLSRSVLIDMLIKKIMA
jgi:1-acyl-sn-glycerol-3-phosphate acyltransferase